MTDINNHASFIWSMADLLRGDFKQSEYGKVILPLTVLRRLDCVIEPVKADMLAKYAELKDDFANFGSILDRLTEIPGLWNTSEFDLSRLAEDPWNVADNLRSYIAGFSPEVRDIIEQFDLESQIIRLERSNLLDLVLSKFAEIDLHLDTVSNIEMGYLYEELLRRSAELSNETAGEHFTPREVIRLMVSLLFIEDGEQLARPGISKTIFDPACGTGGMFSVAEDHLRNLNPTTTLEAYGQELNAEVNAICRSDMMLKGQDAENIAIGNSIVDDGHRSRQFDYLISSPPFGLGWRNIRDWVTEEYQQDGPGGRFGAGLPRINDGSFLFLQHMVSKMVPPDQGGSRVAVVFNGSPLISGTAGSGESEIRRWIIENDWLEAVVALPDQLFYNTGISTYVWIVTNRKSPNRRGKVQLIDARESFTKMRKSRGEKRKELSDDQIADIVRIYGDFDTDDRSKILDNEDFSFLRITVERPLRFRWEITEQATDDVLQQKVVAKLETRSKAKLKTAIREHLDTSFSDAASVRSVVVAVLAEAGLKGNKLENILVEAFLERDQGAAPVVGEDGDRLPDPNLRDSENVPLVAGPSPVEYEVDLTERLQDSLYGEAIASYMESEVLPHVPDAWVDHSKTKIGYEVPITRHFEGASLAESVELRRVASVVRPHREDDPDLRRFPYLPSEDLKSARAAGDLNELEEFPRQWALCGEGDVVGSGRRWRCLPPEFGEAVTPLTVIRPNDGISGAVLAEWLSSRAGAPSHTSTGHSFVSRSTLERLLVPPERDLSSERLTGLLEELERARHGVSLLTEGVVENPFDSGHPKLAVAHAEGLAVKARQVLAIVQGANDPFVHAERTLPHHIAVPARRYSIANSALDRYQLGLKLAESIARVYGVLALSVRYQRSPEITANLSKTFRRGVTFGGWIWVYRDLLNAGEIPELDVLENQTVIGYLDELAEDRNRDAHSHARTSEAAAERLSRKQEELLVACLTESAWMAERRWLYVEVSDYTELGHVLRGQVAHGSHTDWERFELTVSKPLISRRLYLESPRIEESLSLWPYSDVLPCSHCEDDELFLLNSISERTGIMRSLRDHECEVDLK